MNYQHLSIFFHLWYLYAGQNFDLNCFFSCTSPSGKNPTPYSRPNSNASSIAKLCPGTPGTINHITLRVLSALYSYCCSGIDHILMYLVLYMPVSAPYCELLGMGIIFMGTFRLLGTQNFLCMWQVAKWKLLS